MRAADLPSPQAIARAGRLADVLAAVQLHERALPPARRDLALPGRTRIVYVIALVGAGASAGILAEQAEQMVRLGADVTVLSRGDRGDSRRDRHECGGTGASWCRVPYGADLLESVPPCDLIVVGSWELVLPARMLGIAPVVLLEPGGHQSRGDVPAHFKEVVASSLRAASVALPVVDEECGQSGAHDGVATPVAWPSPGDAAELLRRYRDVVATTPVEPPMRGYDVTIGGLRFNRAGDVASLRGRLGACITRRVAVPVSQPAFGPYRAVRWRVVARRATGEEGTTRMYLPARSERPLQDGLAQVGLDLLREHRGDKALARFAAAYGGGSAAEQAVLGRWVVLAMISAGRPGDALEAAVALAGEFPIHPDFVLLFAAAARAARHPIDLGATLERVRLAGVGARYDEWFEDPYHLLVEQLGVSA